MRGWIGGWKDGFFIMAPSHLKPIVMSSPLPQWRPPQQPRTSHPACRRRTHTVPWYRQQATHTHTHARPHVHTHMYRHRCTHTHTHTHAHTHTHTHTHKHTHACTNTHTRTHMHVSLASSIVFINQNENISETASISAFP